MEKWHSYHEIKLQIDVIDSFSGGNQELIVFFTDKNNMQWELYFDCVWDFRYAIELAFISRHFERTEISSIYVVENSEYVKYFENQVSGSRPMEDLKHYIIFDVTDTGLEILANKEPVLTPSSHVSASMASPAVFGAHMKTKKRWWRR